MIVQVFQHVAFEDIGSMREWLAARDAEIRYTCFFAGETPPPLDSFDFLIVMGGPMSVLDEAEFPWLVAEKAGLAQKIELARERLESLMARLPEE